MKSLLQCLHIISFLLLVLLLVYSQHFVKLQDSSSDHASNQERFGYFSSLKNVSEIPNCFILCC